MPKSDELLVADYRNGDEQALAELIRRYLEPIYSYAIRMGGTPSDAEDITQNVFIKLWKTLPRYDSTKRFRTWIFSIAHNTAIDLFRKRRGTPFSKMWADGTEESGQFEESIADSALLPDELFARAMDKHQLEKLLLKIPPTSREVLLLHYNDDLTFDEIGEIMKKSPNTVKSQHRRAILALRDLIEKSQKSTF